MWMMDEFFRIYPKRWGGIKPDFQPKSLSPLQAADFVLWAPSKLAKDYMKEPNNPTRGAAIVSGVDADPAELGRAQ